jgi:hypothetical protein
VEWSVGDRLLQGTVHFFRGEVSVARTAIGWNVDTILSVIALLLAILVLAGAVSATLGLSIAIILLALAMVF